MMSTTTVKKHDGTDIQESRTEGPVNESVVAADTQQKVDRPGQAEVLACTNVALKKLEEVNTDSKENHNKVNTETRKRKSQIVREFARDLERIGFPTDRIATEITQQLYKKVSRSLILGCLDEKYKTSFRVENALKRKPKKNSEGLAPVVPELELNPVVVDTSGRPVTETQQPNRSAETGIDVEGNQGELDDNNEERSTNTESKEESTITPSFNDEVASPIKQNEDLIYARRKVLVSSISMPFEALQKDLAAIFRKNNGKVGKIFFRISVDLGKLVGQIECCGITPQKDVTMISIGKGILTEVQ